MSVLQKILYPPPLLLVILWVFLAFLWFNYPRDHTENEIKGWLAFCCICAGFNLGRWTERKP